MVSVRAYLWAVAAITFVAFMLGANLGNSLGYTAGRQAVEPVACEPNVDSVVVKPTRWPNADSPMCKRCMPSDLNGPIPDSARVP